MTLKLYMWSQPGAFERKIGWKSPEHETTGKEEIIVARNLWLPAVTAKLPQVHCWRDFKNSFNF